MKIFKIYILILVASCSCLKPSKISDEELGNLNGDMTSFNKKLRGYLIKYELKGEISRLDIKLYEDMMKKRLKESEKEYKEFYKLTGNEKLIRTEKNDFIICVKSIQKKVILCDRASTGVTDKVDFDISLNLEELIKEI